MTLFVHAFPIFFRGYSPCESISFSTKTVFLHGKVSERERGREKRVKIIENLAHPKTENVHNKNSSLSTRAAPFVPAAADKRWNSHHVIHFCVTFDSRQVHSDLVAVVHRELWNSTNEKRESPKRNFLLPDKNLRLRIDVHGEFLMNLAR